MIHETDFKKLIDFIESQTGITIPQSNYQQVSDFVSGYTEKNGVTIEDFIKQIQENREEYYHLIESVTVNETYFFREEKHFAYLRNVYFPEKKSNDSEISIWSASCSSGEEALSLYALAYSIFGNKKKYTVYASDINNLVLYRFRQGMYRPNSFRQDGQNYHNLIHVLGTHSSEKIFQISSDHLQSIQIQNRNLFEKQGEDLPKMDLIFLRNTLIYMTPGNKNAIMQNIVDKLKPDGLLFLATSEIPHINHLELSVKEYEDIYFFQKSDKKSISSNTVVLQKEKSEKTISKREFHKLKEHTYKARPKNLIQKKTIPPRLSEEQVCKAVSGRLKNSEYSFTNTAIEEVSLDILSIINAFSLNDVPAEERLVSSLNTKLEQKTPGLLNYFKAYNYYRRDNKKQAINYFRKAIQAYPRLWPANFYLAKLISANSREKDRLIRQTINQIEQYIKDERYDFQFLLEGFNARYFLIICESWLTKPSVRSYEHAD